jgi:hypothetical protein
MSRLFISAIITGYEGLRLESPVKPWPNGLRPVPSPTHRHGHVASLATSESLDQNTSANQTIAIYHQKLCNVLYLSTYIITLYYK